MKSTIVVYTGISWTRPPAKIIMHSIHMKTYSSIHIDVKHKNCMIGKSEYVHQKDTHLMKFLRPWLHLSSSDKLHASSCSFQAFYHLNSSHSGPCHFLVSGQKFLKTVKMSLLSIDVECRPRNEKKIPVGCLAILVSALLDLKTCMLQPAVDLKEDSDEEKVRETTVKHKIKVSVWIQQG